MGTLIPLFWTSGDVCPGVQSQGGPLASVLSCLHTTDSSDSPLVQHLLTVKMSAWQPSLFDQHICRRVIANFVFPYIVFVYIHHQLTLRGKKKGDVKIKC